MPKSEKTTEYDTVVTSEESDKVIYDVEAALKEDLSLIPDEIQLSGRWLLQFRGGELYTKPGWLACNLFFQPIHPVDGQVFSATELEELKSVRYRQFYVSNRDKREVKKIFAALDVGAGPLEDMIEDGKGEYCTAQIRLGKDWRGDPEYKISNFKPSNGLEEVPFELAA